MKRNILKKKSGFALFLVIILLGASVTGCATRVRERQEEPAKIEMRKIGNAKYYHFDDILIPGELKYKQKRSFVYETPQFKTGVLVFSKWWLDVDSLVDFFTYHMEKDNWKIMNIFKGKESIINFSKPAKTCTIKITEKWYGTTEVEVRVGPLGEKKM